MVDIFVESFETDGNGTRYITSVSEFSDGFNDFFTRTNGSNISSSYQVSGQDGDFFFAAQDIDGEVASSQQTLLFSDINISGFTNLNFSALFAEDDDGTNEDWDLPDFVKVEFAIDGGSFQDLLAIESVPDGDNFNAVPAIDTDFDGDGDGTEITDSFTEFSRPIAQTGSTLDLRFTIDLDSGDEDIAIDNIKITGDMGGMDTTPPAIAALTPADDSTGVVDDLSIEFNEAVQLATTGEIRIRQLSDDTVVETIAVTSAQVSVSSDTVTIDPSSDLAENTDFYVEIDAGAIEDTSGNAFAGIDDDTTWNFTTASAEVIDVVINEILFDPASGLDGDANGDGTRDFAEDEFIEIVNNGSSAVDISGWTLSDDDGDDFAFPASTTLAAGQAAVLFGGGTPTGDFGGALVFTDNGSIGNGLSNSGDLVELRDDSGALIASVGYGNAGSVSGGNNESVTRDPDLTGNFVDHSTATGSNGALFSPGTQINGTPFSRTVAINELRISSQSDDNISNYVEIFGAANTSLDGLSLVVLSGEFEPGQVDFAFDLTGLTIDDDNLLLVANSNIANAIPQAVTEANDLLTSFDFFGSPSTFLIVENFTASSGDDLDTDDDGTLDGTFFDAVLDSVSLIDGDGNPDVSYSQTIVGPDGNFAPAGIARDVDGTGTFQQLAFGDFSEDTPGTSNEAPDGGFVEIFEIQGDGDDFTSPEYASPLLGQAVTTSGVVTAVTSDGFYFQDALGDGNDDTSDGIFVFTGVGVTPTDDVDNVEIGDELEVSGTVDEFFQATQIDTVTSITQISTGNSITPIILGSDRVPPTEIVDDAGSTDYDVTRDGRDFYESLEGMLVTLPDAVSVSLTRTFASGADGEFYALANQGTNATGSNARGGITIAEDTSPNNPIGADLNPERIQIDNDLATDSFPDVEVGDLFGDITGVINYSFDDYAISPLNPVIATSTDNLTRETTNLVGTSNQLTVATLNVENLDPNDSDGDTDIADGKFTALGEQIANNLQAPDIITLQEVQDNSGSTDDGTISASDTLQTLVDEISAAGGPAYSFQDNTFIGNNVSGGQPGGNIRVAFLYRSDRVTLDSVQPIGDQNPGSPFNDARLPLVGEFSFGDESITVIGNHFSSKGGSDPLFGDIQPPANGSLDEREAQATAVNDFITSELTTDPDRNIITLGDFNEFQFFSPLETLETNLENLTETLPETERYTFNFEGNSQALDHVLATPELANNAEYDIAHVNTEFKDQATDHDPGVARFSFFNEIEATAGDDNIAGTGEGDLINALDGNDTVRSAEGDDQINGEAGEDRLFGDEGNDTVNGGADNDFSQGGAGNDEVSGGSGNDTVIGDEGNDTLLGNDGNDFLLGEEGNDFLDGGTGNDLLKGDLDSDKTGADIFVLRPEGGRDFIFDFTDGTDLIGLAGGLTFAHLSITALNPSITEITDISDPMNSQSLALLREITPDDLNADDFMMV